MSATLILHNGRIHTMDRANPLATAVAIEDGKFIEVGDVESVMRHRGADTQLIDLDGHTVIPGLNDSHQHLIRGGLNYNLELRWEGVPSLADAMRMLKEQAQRTPHPQWVRVVGGWSEFQFAERRMPTLEELNAAAPDTPVFVLHLYDRALLNRAALRAVGYSKDTPNPPGGEIQRDASGNPTGMLIAKPNALILYATLAKGPSLPLEHQVNSTRQFMRELNRLGVTSVIDAGGGFQNYPDDYAVVDRLARERQLTVRIAYNLFTQHKGAELQDFEAWTGMLTPGQGDDFYRHNGAGEMLVFSAADFEDFLEPRPELAAGMENELEKVVRHLVTNRWPFRLHATYDESIGRMLDVFEKVNREIPFDGLRWMFDHAETVTPRNIERVRALGGGIAIQHRMAFQGEYFVDRYGAEAARETPPVARMLEMGVPVGGGTDATRVASYNPWTALYWLVSGCTVGGLRLYGAQGQLSRETALELWTAGSAWFSSEQDKKGRIKTGQLADMAVLSGDYFSLAEDAIKSLESVLTIVGGAIVYGAGDFGALAPPPIPVLPEWSPVTTYGGHYRAVAQTSALPHACAGAWACMRIGMTWRAVPRYRCRTTPASGAHLDAVVLRSDAMSQRPAASPWSPLRISVFRALWLATVASNIGTWMHDVGASWMMTSLSPDPLMVALVQAAGSLPMFLFALPSGVMADIVDRRKYLIFSQVWMLFAAAALGALALAGLVTPMVLLLATFVLAVGGAMSAPPFQAIVPELVPREELPAAIALNSLGINISRAIGPALGGLILSLLGPPAVFLLNAVSVLGVLVVLWRWRREPKLQRLPAEHFFPAIRTGLRYAQSAPLLRAVLARAIAFFMFASAAWALLPLVARRELGLGPGGYGGLLTAIGVGAVIGALVLPKLRERLSADALTTLASLVFAAATLGLGLVRDFWLMVPVLSFAGLAWIAMLSTLNVGAQRSSAGWVKARALAIYLTAFFGSMTAGSALWGTLAASFGTPAALVMASIGMALSCLSALRWRLNMSPELDLTPSGHLAAPHVHDEPAHDAGPVMVNVEYRIAAENALAFRSAIQEMRRVRRRGGALSWGVFEDVAQPGRYVETFTVESWLEHLRQHDRFSANDKAIKERVDAFHIGPEAPQVQHLIAPG